MRRPRQLSEGAPSGAPQPRPYWFYTAARSIAPASRGLGDRCCPRRRSEGVSQQPQNLKRPRKLQQLQWPSQTAAKSASILVKKDQSRALQKRFRDRERWTGAAPVNRVQ